MGREVVLLSWSRARPAAAALWAQRRGTLALGPSEKLESCLVQT